MNLNTIDIPVLLMFMPIWAQVAIIFALALVAALIVHWAAYRVAERLVANRSLFWRSFVARSKAPARFALILAALSIGARAVEITGTEATLLSKAFIFAFILLLGWLAHIALHISTVVYSRRFSLESEDNLLARKHLTQTRILRRVADILIFVATFSIALMTFESVRQYGVSLLASAGAAGLIIGFALQSVIKNLFAGIQIAITQPIRLDDAVLVEGEWGNIEEITSTYVVVRIWDLRRLVLPISYFIDNPFQNWTREGSALLGNVVLYLDYSAPMDAIRAEAKNIIEASPLWDGKVQTTQVIDATERAIQVRILCSAKNSAIAWDLRCEVREKIIAFIAENHPQALTRTRSDIESAPQLVPDQVMERALKGEGGNPG